MKNVVSIIIPVYCAENTIERCVKSLIRGNYSDMEIILVEDCSSDNSWKACMRLQEQYPCVKAYQNLKNSGPSATRNHGLQVMTGKYLMFVDSDDWVEPDYVSSFVEAYQRYQPELVVSGYINHDEVQNASTEYFGWGDAETITVKKLKNELLPMYHGRLLQQIWNKLFFAEIVQENHLFFDTTIQIGEDFRFLLSYLEHTSGDKVVQINKPLYHYLRCSGNSLMSQFGREKFDETIRNLERLYTKAGMCKSEIIEQLRKDRKTQIELWAYLIMHNMGMKNTEKKKLIFNLDVQNGPKLYRKNKILYYKERVVVFLKRIGISK